MWRPRTNVLLALAASMLVACGARTRARDSAVVTPAQTEPPEAPRAGPSAPLGVASIDELHRGDAAALVAGARESDARGAHDDADGAILRAAELDLPATLAALRAAGASLAGAALRLAPKLAATEQAWSAAVARGVPAVMWRAKRLSEEMRGSTTPELLRAGVYVHDTRRFLPYAAPAEPGTLGLMIDPARGVVVHLHGSLSDGCGVLCHAVIPSRVIVQDTSTRGAIRADLRPNPGEEETSELVIELTPRGLRYRMHAYPDHPWTDLLSRVAPAAGAPRRALHVMTQGSIATEIASGYSLVGRVLRGPGLAGDVPLAAAHALASYHTVIVSPDGGVIMVASTRSDCVCSAKMEAAMHEHVLTRVDARTGEATLVHEGEGAVLARFAPDGALYVQLGVEVRFAPSAREPARIPIMDGVLLAPPLGPRIECCSA